MPDDDLERRAQARVGRMLDDKYLLERLLGVGGMAAVYEARHRNGMRAAVKVLHLGVARDEEVRRRFRNEGYAANKVDHPGVVRVLDDDDVKSGDDKGTTYLVMELLEGESVLERARRKGVLDENEVLAIAEGVLDVLERAHAHGIVHRDLKPDNLFLVKDEEGRERVKVLDFGIARIAETAGRTKVGTTLGTPSYMSPEQARGNREEIDGRSDLFALGATMFRLLTSRRIHEGDSSAEILGKHGSVPAPPIRSIAPQVSERVAAIVDRALQFDRAARYADAAAMREDVRAARASESLSSYGVASPVGFASGSEPTGIGAAAPVVVQPTIVRPSGAIVPGTDRHVAPVVPKTASHPVLPVELPRTNPALAVASPPVVKIALLGALFVALAMIAVAIFGRSRPRPDIDPAPPVADKALAEPKTNLPDPDKAPRDPDLDPSPKVHKPKPSSTAKPATSVKPKP